MKRGYLFLCISALMSFATVLPREATVYEVDAEAQLSEKMALFERVTGHIRLSLDEVRHQLNESEKNRQNDGGRTSATPVDALHTMLGGAAAKLKVIERLQEDLSAIAASYEGQIGHMVAGRLRRAISRMQQYRAATQSRFDEITSEVAARDAADHGNFGLSYEEALEDLLSLSSSQVKEVGKTLQETAQAVDAAASSPAFKDDALIEKLSGLPAQEKRSVMGRALERSIARVKNKVGSIGDSAKTVKVAVDSQASRAGESVRSGMSTMYDRVCDALSGVWQRIVAFSSSASQAAGDACTTVGCAARGACSTVSEHVSAAGRATYDTAESLGIRFTGSLSTARTAVSEVTVSFGSRVIAGAQTALCAVRDFCVRLWIFVRDAFVSAWKGVRAFFAADPSVPPHDDAAQRVEMAEHHAAPEGKVSYFAFLAEQIKYTRNSLLCSMTFLWSLVYSYGELTISYLSRAYGAVVTTVKAGWTYIADGALRVHAYGADQWNAWFDGVPVTLETAVPAVSAVEVVPVAPVPSFFDRARDYGRELACGVREQVARFSQWVFSFYEQPAVLKV